MLLKKQTVSPLSCLFCKELEQLQRVLTRVPEALVSNPGRGQLFLEDNFLDFSFLSHLQVGYDSVFQNPLPLAVH
jgi:hypothetical protein